MRCSNCGERFSASRRSGGPGGYSSPGWFLIINAGLLLALVVLLQAGHPAIGVVAGLMLLIGLSANLTSWDDCNHHMGPDGERLAGLDCPRCRHVNKVFPWSL
jgi:hypothetical protein